MILRDLVTRLTFRTDVTPLKNLDNQVQGIVGGVRRLAAVALSGWAIRAGGSIEMLREQFKTLWGEGAKPFREEMDRLQKETGGMFTPRELLEAGVRAKQAGLNGKEAAEALHLASRLLVRSGGDIGQAMDMLVQGMQQGGLAQIFRELGLITPKIQNIIDYYEERIAQAGANTPLGQELVRQFSRQLLEGFQDPEVKARFDKQFSQFLTTPAAEVKRSWSQVRTVGDELSSQIVQGLAPALKGLNDIFKTLNDNLREFGGIKGAVESVSESVLGLFKNQLTPSQVGGLTVGGLLMFMVTRNPIWLGLSGAALGQGAYNLGAEAREWVDEQMYGPPGSPERLRAQKEQEQLEERLRGTEGMGSPLDDALKNFREQSGGPPPQGSINWHGDLNIYPSEGMNEEAVGRAVRKELGLHALHIITQNQGSLEG